MRTETQSPLQRWMVVIATIFFPSQTAASGDMKVGTGLTIAVNFLGHMVPRLPSGRPGLERGLKFRFPSKDMFSARKHTY